MITGEIKSQVDSIWDAFWSGGISNPLEVIEQMTYLLFIKRLDELHTLREKQANRLGGPIKKPIFASDQQELRWSVFREFGDAKKRLPIKYSRSSRHWATATVRTARTPPTRRT